MREEGLDKLCQGYHLTLTNDEALKVLNPGKRATCCITKQVEGHSLQLILKKVAEGDETYAPQYTQKVLLDLFISVCKGVSYAHSCDVLHGNLTPSHIYVSNTGEIIINNWKKKAILKDNTDSLTYKAPEQLLKKKEEFDEQSDIYALGAILYHILTLKPLYEPMTAKRLLKCIEEKYFKAPRARSPKQRIAPVLNAICLKALEENKLHRYIAVDYLISDIRNGLKNKAVTAYRPPRPIRFLRQCRNIPLFSIIMIIVFLLLLSCGSAFILIDHTKYHTTLESAQQLQMKGYDAFIKAAKAYEHLEKLPETVFNEKRDEEITLQQQFNQSLTLMHKLYAEALSQYQFIRPIHQAKRAIKDGYREIFTNQIDFALHRGKFEEAVEFARNYEMRIETIYDRESEKYLTEFLDLYKGLGVLNISAGDDAAKATLYPLADDDGRLVILDPIMKSALPRELVGLQRGSYVLIVRPEKKGRFVYPYFMEPCSESKLVIHAPEKISEEMVFVPGGPCYIGGDKSSIYRKHIETLPSFFIKKYEVTFGEYLEFWKSLKEELEREKMMSLIYFERSQRSPTAAWDQNGKILYPEIQMNHPIVGISQAAATAYCKWLSTTTGRKIRLPTAIEWEKAARGVDGRTYVWGDGFMPTDAFITSNLKAKKKHSFFAPVGTFSFDSSVYGVFDMAGNAREWTSSSFLNESTRYIIKGASAFSSVDVAPCSAMSDVVILPSDIGFRYVEDL